VSDRSLLHLPTKDTAWERQTLTALFRRITADWYKLLVHVTDGPTRTVLNIRRHLNMFQIKAGPVKSAQRLLGCGLDVRSSISRQRLLFFDTSSTPSGYQDPCSWRRNALGMQLTAHPYLIHMFRMRGVTSLLLHTSPCRGACPN
jgi:hypothetical protein